MNNPRVLHQTADPEASREQTPITACTSSGLIYLGQGSNDIVINRASVPELIKLLRELKVLAEEEA